MSIAKRLVSVAVGFVVTGLVWAGEMEPPDPPLAIRATAVDFGDSRGEVVLLQFSAYNSSPAVEGIKLCFRKGHDLLLIDRLSSGTKKVVRLSLPHGSAATHLVVCYSRGQGSFSEVVEVQRVAQGPPLSSAVTGPLIALIGVLVGGLLSGLWSWKRESHQQRVSWAKELYLRDENTLRVFLEAVRTGSPPLLPEAYEKLCHNATIPVEIRRTLDEALVVLRDAGAPKGVYDEARQRVEEALEHYRREPWHY